MKIISAKIFSVCMLIKLSSCRTVEPQTKRGLIGGEPVAADFSRSDFFVEIIYSQSLTPELAVTQNSAGVLIGNRYILTYAHGALVQHEKWHNR